MRKTWGSSLRFWSILLGLAILLPWGWSLATPPLTFNEREVKSQRSELDKGDVWSLDFRFKDPRVLKIHVPGRGTRICWYLWYQVINRTDQPRTFIPDFELVTTDIPGAYHDEVLPAVQEAIKKIEDPTGYQDIKNSVTIASKPIPPSKTEDAFPRTVTGVAIWDGTSADVKMRSDEKKDLADATRFSIFVSGLSNGWVLAEPVGKGPDAIPVIRRKTLQLNFQRLGDRHAVESREISFVPPSEWMYRAARLRVPTPVKEGEPKAVGKINGAIQLPTLYPTNAISN